MAGNPRNAAMSPNTRPAGTRHTDLHATVGKGGSEEGENDDENLAIGLGNPRTCCHARTHTTGTVGAMSSLSMHWIASTTDHLTVQ